MLNKRPLVVLGFLLALLVPALFQISRPFLTPALLAGVLAIVLHPANQWLTRHLKRPTLSTSLTTFSIMLVLAGLLVFVGFTISSELQSSYNALSRRSLQEGGWPAMVASTTDRLVDVLATRIPLDKDAIRDSFMNGLQNVAGRMAGSVGTAVGGVTTAVLGILFTTVFLYFLLLHGKQWLATLSDIVPLEKHVIDSLFQTVEDSVTATVYGVIAVALGQGLFVALGFWMAGVRSPALWGTIGGVCSIIPVLGAPLVWVPVVIAYAIAGAWWKVLFLALWGAFVVGSVDNVLRPLVMGVRAKQPPLVMALGAIGGTWAFGVLGILVGPLVVSLAGALVKEIQILRVAEKPGT